MKKFIIKITENGKDFYFEYSCFGVCNKDGSTKTPPMGYFTANLEEAMKFDSEERAQMVSAGYDGSKVVAIEE